MGVISKTTQQLMNVNTRHRVRGALVPLTTKRMLSSLAEAVPPIGRMKNQRPHDAARDEEHRRDESPFSLRILSKGGLEHEALVERVLQTAGT